MSTLIFIGLVVLVLVGLGAGNTSRAPRRTYGTYGTYGATNQWKRGA